MKSEKAPLKRAIDALMAKHATLLWGDYVYSSPTIEAKVNALIIRYFEESKKSA